LGETVAACALWKAEVFGRDTAEVGAAELERETASEGGKVTATVRMHAERRVAGTAERDD
jgi:hypothetical protein